MAESNYNNSVVIYQFKITLKGTNPKIWRRIQIPASVSFWKLHLAIQDAMGWYNCHLHEFRMSDRVSGETISICNLTENNFNDMEFVSEKHTKLDSQFTLSNKRAIYEYDFGDSWKHEILLENISFAVEGITYPRCLAGKRACPPEDCGSVFGYYELLHIITHPEHDEYMDRKTWLDEVAPNFNPDFFDANMVTFDNNGEYED